MFFANPLISGWANTLNIWFWRFLAERRKQDIIDFCKTRDNIYLPLIFYCSPEPSKPKVDYFAKLCTKKWWKSFIIILYPYLSDTHCIIPAMHYKSHYYAYFVLPVFSAQNFIARKKQYKKMKALLILDDCNWNRNVEIWFISYKKKYDLGGDGLLHGKYTLIFSSYFSIWGYRTRLNLIVI